MYNPANTYTFAERPDGNIEVFENGNPIGVETPENATMFWKYKPATATKIDPTKPIDQQTLPPGTKTITQPDGSITDQNGNILQYPPLEAQAGNFVYAANNGYMSPQEAYSQVQQLQRNGKFSSSGDFTIQKMFGGEVPGTVTSGAENITPPNSTTPTVTATPTMSASPAPVPVSTSTSTIPAQTPTPAPVATAPGVNSGQTINELMATAPGNTNPNQIGGNTVGALPNQTTEQDAAFDELMKDPNLTPDQKQALKAYYDAIATNDKETADRIASAIKFGTEFSDPYFKAQARLLTDELSRAFSAKEGDLAYNESSLKNALEDLKKDIGASKEYLSFQQQQELKSLEKQYSQQLEQTQQDLAATGKTVSSVRNRAEQLLGESYGDLRESTNRAFLEKNRRIDNQLAITDRNTQLEIARLQTLTAEGKTDLLRQKEAQLGSDALTKEGYTGLLGDIGGELPRQKTLDALNFASGIVF